VTGVTARGRTVRPAGVLLRVALAAGTRRAAALRVRGDLLPAVERDAQERVVLEGVVAAGHGRAVDLVGLETVLEVRAVTGGGVVQDLVPLALDVDDRVGVVLPRGGRAVELVPRDHAAGGLLLDVDVLGSDRLEGVVDRLVVVRLVGLAPGVSGP